LRNWHLGLVAAWLAMLPMSARAADVTVSRSVGRFETVRVDGRFVLHIAVGAKQAVSLSGDRYLIDNLRITTMGGVLAIVRPQGFDLPHDQTVTITIETPKLTALDVRGLVHARVTGLTGRRFALTNNGTAAMTLAGDVGHFKLISRGVASIDAGALHAASLSVMLRGQGNMRVFASHDAIVTLYGEGRVVVLGHPPVHQFKTLAYGVISLK